MTVKSCGVTAAAKHLSISQPSLSSQLKVLEDFLQVKLFKKNGRKNELTTQGAIIFGFCRQMFEISEGMHESITEKMPYVSRRIHIGISNEIANSFVVEIVAHFLQKFNTELRPKVMMISGSHEKLEEQLSFREIDIIVTSQAMINPDLKNLEEFEVPVNLVCSSADQFSPKKHNQNVHQLLTAINKGGISQWVMPPQGLKLRSEINHFLEVNSIEGRVVFESDVIESLVRSVVDGVGIAFLPLIYVPKELEYKSLYSLGPKQGFWKHRLCLSSHSKNKDEYLIQSLAFSFREICDPIIKQ